MQNSLIIYLPRVHSYRLGFLDALSERYDLTVISPQKGRSLGHDLSDQRDYVARGGFLVFIKELLKNTQDYNVCVVRNFSIEMAMLLLTGLSRKSILWTHGLSMRNYMAESKSIPLFKILIFRMFRGIFVYTENEKKILKSELQNMPIYALNNSICLEENFTRENRQFKMNQRSLQIGMISRFSSKHRAGAKLSYFLSNVTCETDIIGAGKMLPSIARNNLNSH